VITGKNNNGAANAVLGMMRWTFLCKKSWWHKILVKL